MRRVHQTAESDKKGGIWIVGGQRADGSGITLDETWQFNSSSDAPRFGPLSQPVGSVVGATSTLLSDGSLLMLGGQDENGQLQSLETLAVLNTATGSWSVINATGSTQSSIPSPRRNHVAVSLPSRRIFIHGGAADTALTSALSDAWILDWSKSPPTWSQLPTLDGAPSARFGHSAVAYGRKIALTLGWSGGNPADNAVYIFDATALTSTTTGNSGGNGWSGGSWSSQYTPDPHATASASPSDSSASKSNGGGNGSSSSSGGNSEENSSGTGSSGGSTGTSASPFQPTSSNGNLNNHTDDGTSPGVKAGAVIGALVGCGLAFAAGYFLYQRHQDNKIRNYRYGDGAGALLGGGGAEGPYPFAGFSNGYARGAASEKPWAAYAPGVKPAGPRAYGQSADMFDSSAYDQRKEPQWQPVADNPATRPARRDAVLSPGAMGHAKEGSGPRMRQRLALLTGLTSWGAAEGPRFDMLADEDDDIEGLALTKRSSRRRTLDDEDEDDEDDDLGAHIQEKSYSRLGQPNQEMGPEGEDSFEYNDEGAHRYSHDQPYVTSPFEDESDENGGAATATTAARWAGGGLLAAISSMSYGRTNESRGQRLHDADDEYDHSRSSFNSSRPDTSPSGPSDTSHNSSSQSRSHATTSSKSSRSQAGQTQGALAFSDVPYHAGAGGSLGRSTLSRRSHANNVSLPAEAARGDGSGSLMKRSPTWWERFMNGAGRMERTASGRLAPSSSALQPIRDPAPPPELGLSVIKESPRSADPSEDNPFADVIRFDHDDAKTTPFDEMGRKRHRAEGDIDGRMYEGTESDSWDHNRSLSSLQSGRTGASSHLEARFRDMDVVQRTRTGSSRRTASTRRTGLSSGSSDGGFPRRRTSRHSDSTSPGILSRMGSILESDHHSLMQYDSDVTPGQVVWRGPGDWEDVRSSEDREEVMHAESGIVDTTVGDVTVVADESLDITTQQQRHKEGVLNGQVASRAVLRSSSGHYFPRDVSEVPSITPATTKRARLNPQLTSPIREMPPRSPTNAQLKAAAEAATVRDRVKAIESLNAAAAVPASSSSPTSPLSAKTGMEQLDRTGSKAKRNNSQVSHGLAPRPQLFVANPDGSL